MSAGCHPGHSVLRGSICGQAVPTSSISKQTVPDDVEQWRCACMPNVWAGPERKLCKAPKLLIAMCCEDASALVKPGLHG